MQIFGGSSRHIFLFRVLLFLFSGLFSFFLIRGVAISALPLPFFFCLSPPPLSERLWSCLSGLFPLTSFPTRFFTLLRIFHRFRCIDLSNAFPFLFSRVNASFFFFNPLLFPQASLLFLFFFSRDKRRREGSR